MKLVIDDKIPFIRNAVSRLGEAVFLPGSSITAADVRDADALIVRTRTRCNEGLLAGSKVKFIATATIGFDHLDVAWLRRAGIAWSNCPGCNARSVAQYVESALLLLHSAGRIDLSRHPVMGIVGVGHVGSVVASVARRMGLRLMLCDPPRFGAKSDNPDLCIRTEECTSSLEDIAREAEIIAFHTPLTTTGRHATFHLADDRFFCSLEHNPVIISCGRGEVISTSAIFQAITEGKIREAVIDVWENEPAIDVSLLKKTFLSTPHIAGYSADGKARGTRMALQAVARFFGIDADFSDILPPPLPEDFKYFPDAPAAPRLTASQQALLDLYDPRRDSEALRCEPEAFERLRGNYPLRREPAD